MRIATAGINVILLDKPYNVDCAHENITRVKDWNEIRRLFVKS